MTKIYYVSKIYSVYRYVRENKEFIMQCKIPLIACLCPVCENYILCVEGINKTVEKEEKLPNTCQNITEDCCNKTVSSMA